MTDFGKEHNNMVHDHLNILAQGEVGEVRTTFLRLDDDLTVRHTLPNGFSYSTVHEIGNWIRIRSSKAQFSRATFTLNEIDKSKHAIRAVREVLTELDNANDSDPFLKFWLNLSPEDLSLISDWDFHFNNPVYGSAPHVQLIPNKTLVYGDIYVNGFDNDHYDLRSTTDPDLHLRIRSGSFHPMVIPIGSLVVHHNQIKIVQKSKIGFLNSSRQIIATVYTLRNSSTGVTQDNIHHAALTGIVRWGSAPPLKKASKIVI